MSNGIKVAVAAVTGVAIFIGYHQYRKYQQRKAVEKVFCELTNSLGQSFGEGFAKSLNDQVKKK